MASAGFDVIAMVNAASDSNDNRLCLKTDVNRTTWQCNQGPETPKNLFDFLVNKRGFTVDRSDIIDYVHFKDKIGGSNTFFC